MNNTIVRTEFFNTSQHMTVLPPEERMRLAKLAREGDDDACVKLIFGMTKLILKLAIRDYGISYGQLEDVVQETYLELFKLFSTWQPEGKKVPKFNPNFGNNPITYAHYYIKKAIGEYLRRNKSSIRLSRENIFLVRRAKQFLSSQESLSQREIEAYIDQFVNDHGVTLENFLAAFRAYGVLSLDAYVDERESENTHLDFVPSSQDNLPETQAIIEIRNDSLYKIMRKALSEREVLILQLRYGVHGCPHTYREIGKKLGEIKNKKTGEKKFEPLTGEMVRRIINSSKAKLKSWLDNHPQDSDTLQRLFIGTN